MGGGAEPEFETLPAIEREVDGAETGTVAGLLGQSGWLFCRCGATQLSGSDADRIGEAVWGWFEGAKHGPTRPITVTVTVQNPFSRSRI